MLKNFSKESLWLPKNEQLHITFAHVISPDSKYKIDRTKLWKDLHPEVKRALEEITKKPLNIEVQFNELLSFQASIIVKGYDNGSYDKLRNKFIKLFNLPDESRRPPNIIHATVARFRNELPFDNVKTVTDGIGVSFTDSTQKLQLIHEEKIFVQSHSVISSFPRE